MALMRLGADFHRALIEQSPIVVAVSDEHGTAIWRSTGSTGLFAFDESRSVPDQLADLVHPADLPAARQAMAQAVTQRPHDAVEVRVKGTDGSWRVVSLLARNLLDDPAVRGIAWYVTDVTRIREAERQTRGEAARLMTLIRRTLEERARMLTELATFRTEFVGVVSHELRTPLTSITTFATMLEGDAAALDPDECAAAVTAIRRNADRMLSLVADLILLATLESGEMVLEVGPVDVAALTRRATAASGSGHVNLRVDVHDGPEFVGDARLLAQLFDMTVGVMVAGSATGAEVVVSAEPTGDAWRVAVSTSAADVATTERLLSTRLPHPDAADERRTGALAVMLARAIARSHGGELSIAMREPGAIVIIDLPRNL